YDSQAGKVVLFGGWGGGSYFGDTWEWNGTTWTQVSSTGPAPRVNHAMAYDSQRQKTVLFGGRDGSLKGDTWEWNGTTWTQVSTTGPLPRNDHAMAYDSQRGKVVLFGGYDGGYPGDTWEYPFYTPLLSSGLHTWFTCACDAAGNCTRSTSVRSFRVDNAPPAPFDLSSPRNNVWSNGSGVTFRWQDVSDVDSGLAYYRLFLNGVQQGGNLTVSNYSYPGALSSATHTWYVVAYDNVSNATQSTSTFTLKVDNLPPAVFSLLTPANNGFTATNQPILSWQASSDGESGLDYYQLVVDPQTSGDLSGSNYSNYNFGPAAGSFIESPISIVGAGNVLRVSVYYKFNHAYWSDVRISLVSPAGAQYVLFNQEGGNASGVYSETVSNIAVFNGETVNGIWKLKAEDLVNVDSGYLDEWTLNIWKSGAGGIDVAATGTSYLVPQSQSLAEGNHTWYVKAIDKLANTRQTSTWSFKVDTQPPLAFTLKSPANGWVANLQTPEVCWNLTTDAVSGVAKYQLYQDGVLHTDNLGSTTSCSTLFITEGYHTWYVKAVDGAGNVRQSTDTRTIIGEWDKPYAFDLIAPADTAIIYTNRPIFSWGPSGDAGIGLCRYELWIGSTCWDNCNIAPNFTNYQVISSIPNGTHSWYIKAFDCVGNFRASASVRSFTNYECQPTTVEHCQGNDTGECDAGNRTCDANGYWGNCQGIIGPIPELCDNLDNDCDGVTDNGYSNKGQTCAQGLGICKCNGVYICRLDGLSTICDCVTGTPQIELCNSLDDNCDGQTDEGFPGTGGLCYEGIGECKRNGLTVCKPDGSDVMCNAVPGTPTAELCDIKDNNCDGSIDEDFTNLGLPCSVGVGACKRQGNYACKADKSGTECPVTPGTPTQDLCDNLDNNCDGKTDEAFALGVSCVAGQGECAATGTLICAPSGASSTCQATPKQPSLEMCGDGADNDCDGSVDEECVCLTGFDRPCGSNTSECLAGTQTCASGKWGLCLGGIKPTQELCDTKDNDCDGVTDEGCFCSLGDDRVCGADAGVCHVGWLYCGGNGRWGECTNALLPAPELCDAEDNDCDAVTDENFPEKNQGCSLGLGECVATGTYICAPDKKIAVCSAVPKPSQSEMCDAKDNDCDGQTDEDFGFGQSCTLGQGECRCVGQKVCDGLYGSRCNCAPGSPQSDRCDQKDNDCDGQTDEDFIGLGGGCTMGIGLCLASGYKTCKPDGSGIQCSAFPSVPVTELCDGLDNDCDGVTDNGFPLGQSCEDGLGECKCQGAFVCDLSNPAKAKCDCLGKPPATEVCDSKDNNCDGKIDEDFLQKGKTCTTGIGACQTLGTYLCQNGVVKCPAIPGKPQDEVCDDKVDNDCDGATDDKDDDCKNKPDAGVSDATDASEEDVEVVDAAMPDGTNTDAALLDGSDGGPETGEEAGVQDASSVEEEAEAGMEDATELDAEILDGNPLLPDARAEDVFDSSQPDSGLLNPDASEQMDAEMSEAGSSEEDIAAGSQENNAVVPEEGCGCVLFQPTSRHSYSSSLAVDLMAIFFALYFFTRPMFSKEE
ncbi:MAG: MopE-related protein, partial [bacterium]|nr:MopE-related protein [bacterium]